MFGLTYPHKAANWLGKWVFIALFLYAPTLYAANVGVNAEQYDKPTEQAPEKLLFAFGNMICAANSVATSDQQSVLHNLLLDCPSPPPSAKDYDFQTQVQQQVAQWPVVIREDALTFLLQHAMAITNFNALVVQMVGPPPSFSPNPDGAILGVSEGWTSKDRATLSQILQQAWIAGHMDTFWKQVAPAWKKTQVTSYDVRDIARRVQKYLPLPYNKDLKVTYVTINPLMPTGSGVTSIYTDNHYNVILGPSANHADAQTLLAHELSHPIINAFFKHDERAKRILAHSTCVYKAVQYDPDGQMGIGSVYTNWEAYFSETLVRAISHHLMNTAEPDDGFILQPTISWELDRYDTGHYRVEDLMFRSLNKLTQNFCPKQRNGYESIYQTRAMRDIPKNRPKQWS